jgi:hypothetical protein
MNDLNVLVLQIGDLRYFIIFDADLMNYYFGIPKVIGAVKAICLIIAIQIK